MSIPAHPPYTPTQFRKARAVRVLRVVRVVRPIRLARFVKTLQKASPGESRGQSLQPIRDWNIWRNIGKSPVSGRLNGKIIQMPIFFIVMFDCRRVTDYCSNKCGYSWFVTFFLQVTFCGNCGLFYPSARYFPRGLVIARVIQGYWGDSLPSLMYGVPVGKASRETLMYIPVTSVA